MQIRSVSETCQTRPTHNGVESIGYCRPSGKTHCRNGGKMNLVSSPALRPSFPHGCRKRPFGQGHALSGHFVGLDLHALASGHKYSRATDEEASGGGFVKGSSLSSFASHSTTPSPYGCHRHSGTRISRRHAHHADHTLCRMPIRRPPNDVQVFAAYRPPRELNASPLLSPCSSATRRIRSSFPSDTHPPRS